MAPDTPLRVGQSPDEQEVRAQVQSRQQNGHEHGVVNADVAAWGCIYDGYWTLTRMGTVPP